MSGLTISGLRKAFKTRKSEVAALDGIDLHVASGELVAIVGASGCGKSTLLNIVAGLEQPSAGSVTVDGEPIVGPGPDRGMVFQAYSLYPWRSVASNIAFGLECAGWRRGRIKDRVDELLGILDLHDYADALPKTLSGGMRQRVAIGRALAPEPDILLLDEPFGALDAQTRGAMQDFLLDVWQRTGATILFVTHDIEEAVYLSERVYVFTSRPGSVAAEIEVPFEHIRGPLTKRDPRFLDLRDEIQDMLWQARGTPLRSSTRGAAG